MSNLPFTTLACFILLFMTLITSRCHSARILPDSNPNPTRNHGHIPQKITFLMRDIFNTSTTKTSLPTPKPNLIPFSKPQGLYFPPRGGVLIPSSPPGLGLGLGLGMSFPGKGSLQEMEVGVVTDISEDVYRPEPGSQVVGKAQGMFVVSSEDGTSHMMAMRVKLGGRAEDGLRLFGVNKADASESHIAVIGGIGKFEGANGYASVERVRGVEHKLLKFSVYLR